MKTHIAIDIGGTNMRAASYPQDSTEPIKYNRISTRSEGLPVEDRLNHLIETVWPDDYPVSAVGVAAPGPLDPVNGIIIQPPNIPEWNYFPLQEFLVDKLDIPVLIDNDANMAAFGEWNFGAGRGCHHLIYLTISTGIGGGIIINDQLLSGANGFAGEIGHMTIHMEGPLCSCGEKGHLEAFASGPAIVRWLKSQLETDKLQELFPDKELTAKVVEDSARAGNQLAAAAYERAGRYIGTAISSLLHLFNPEIIILGGGVSRAGELLFTPIQETVEETVISDAYLDNLTIVPASLGDDSGLLGALALARNASS